MYDKKFFVQVAKEGTAVFIFIIIVEGLFHIIRDIIVWLYNCIRRLIKYILSRHHIEYPIAIQEDSAHYIQGYTRTSAGVKLGTLLQEEQYNKQNS